MLPLSSSRSISINAPSYFVTQGITRIGTPSTGFGSVCWRSGGGSRIRGVSTQWSLDFLRASTRAHEGMLRRHLAPAAALRETQLSIMQDPLWKDPYDWAAFTLQGT